MRKNPPEDSFQIRCAKLGHQIHFGYCQKENFGLPCVRTLICWHPYFDVEGYLRHEMTKEQWQEVFETQPKPKTVTLVELIEQAQKRKEKGEE